MAVLPGRWEKVAPHHPGQPFQIEATQEGVYMRRVSAPEEPSYNINDLLDRWSDIVDGVDGLRVITDIGRAINQGQMKVWMMIPRQPGDGDFSKQQLVQIVRCKYAFDYDENDPFSGHSALEAELCVEPNSGIPIRLTNPEVAGDWMRMFVYLSDLIEAEEEIFEVEYYDHSAYSPHYKQNPTTINPLAANSDEQHLPGYLLKLKRLIEGEAGPFQSPELAIAINAWLELSEKADAAGNLKNGVTTEVKHWLNHHVPEVESIKAIDRISKVTNWNKPANWNKNRKG